MYIVYGEREDYLSLPLLLNPLMGGSHFILVQLSELKLMWLRCGFIFKGVDCGCGFISSKSALHKLQCAKSSAVLEYQSLLCM